MPVRPAPNWGANRRLLVEIVVEHMIERAVEHIVKHIAGLVVAYGVERIVDADRGVARAEMGSARRSQLPPFA